MISHSQDLQSHAKELHSDLTDAQWKLIKRLFARQTFRKHHPRSILNALFYLNKTGCQWRFLPEGFPPWQTVYYHFRRWVASGLLERLTDALRRYARARVGRKRHIVTNTLGFLLAVLVHPANLSDSQQAPHLLKRLLGKSPCLKVVFADGGYAGTPAGLVWRCFGWLWQLVRRQEKQRGFAVLEKRWVVEHTFAWFGGWRRLSKDYERLPQVSEAMVRLSAIRMMIRRIA